jgi:hypothetical protein
MTPEQPAPGGVSVFGHRQGRLGQPWTGRAELVARSADACTFGAVLARSEPAIRASSVSVKSRIQSLLVMRCPRPIMASQ